MSDQPMSPGDPKPLTHDEALATLNLKKIYEYCNANPKNDPYVGVTADLMRSYPKDEEQIVLNFIDALSHSNMKMKGIIANLSVQLQAWEGQTIVKPEAVNIRRGHGPLPERKN